MTLAARIQQVLTSYKIKHRVFQHARVDNVGRAAQLLQLPVEQTLTAQVVADEFGMLLVVIPSLHQLDLPTLCRQLNRKNLAVLSKLKTNQIFSDCDAGCWPPFGKLYGLETVFDVSVRSMQQFYCTSGSRTGLLQMQIDGLAILEPRAKFLPISTPVGTESRSSELDIKGETLQQALFPKLPGIASKLLQLATDEKHSIQELIALVSQDADIQQQILLYTQLPFVQGKLSQQPANLNALVEHVLGFDMVSHIALGVAAGRAFHQPVAEAEDTQNFWRHAFHAASYAERITQLIAADQQLDPAISYLAGLFHNFGLLLISQMYPPEYALLKKWLRIYPKTSIAILEQRLLGMGRAFEVLRSGHAQLGEALLRYWQMPEAICIVAKEHHSDNYTGIYSSYVKIIQITNQLLREKSIGDGTTKGVDPAALAALGLNEQQVRQSIHTMPEYSSSLELMARSLFKK